MQQHCRIKLGYFISPPETQLWGFCLCSGHSILENFSETSHVTVISLDVLYRAHSRFKVQGFFICHIIVIQGITRSEMQSNQVRSVTVQNNKNTNYISNITQGHTYGKKRRNKNKMCNEIKKCKTIRCAKNNKMCKRQ